MKIYISGPITNRSIGDAVAQFCGMETKLSKAGHVPINPIRMQPYGLTWKTYMDIAKAILHSQEIEAVMMLCGWRESHGACLEWIWAQAAGIPIMYESASDAMEMRERESLGR